MEELVYQGRPDEQAGLFETLKGAAHSVAARVGLGERDAVVLTGGFGRGEGALLRAPEGTGTPFGDVDLLLIGNGPRPGQRVLDDLKSRLASTLSADFVDLGYIRASAFRRAEPTVFLYELRNGSMVLWGSPGALERVPSFRAQDIPLSEATRFFLNRGTGLLSVFLMMMQDADGALVRKCAATAWSKTVLAAGDSFLVRRKLYHWSYAERLRRLEEALGSCGKDGFLERYTRAANFKLTADFGLLPSGDPHELCLEARRLHEDHFRRLEQARTFSTLTDWREYPDVVLRVGLIPFRRRLKESFQGLAVNFGRPAELLRFARLPLWGEERRLALLPLILYAVAERGRFSVDNKYVEAASALQLGTKGEGIRDWGTLAGILAGDAHP